MTRRALILLVLMGAADAARAGIVFDEPQAQWGRVAAAGILRHAFPFRVDQEPAQIVDVRASCGCLRPMVEKRVYQTGETGNVVLLIHPLGQVGQKRFQLTLTVRDPKERSIVLTVETELVSQIAVTPAQLLLYINGKESLMSSILIQDRRQPILAIESMSTSTPRLTATLASSNPSEHRIALLVSGDFPPGTHEEKVVIRTRDPLYSLLEIPVTVVRRGRCYVLPESVRLTRHSPTGRSRRLWVRDARSQPIELGSISSSLAGVTVHPERAGEGRTILDVRLEDESAPQGSIGEIRIEVLTPEAVVLTVPVTVD